MIPKVFAHLDDVVAFINRGTDDALLDDLLWALVGVNWNSAMFRRRGFRRARVSSFKARTTAPVPTAFGLIRLTLAPIKLGRERSPGRDEALRWRIALSRGEPGVETNPTEQSFRQLGRGDLPEAENRAARRLWADGLAPFGWGNRLRRSSRYDTGSAIDPKRMLAACLFPLSPASLERLARQVLNPPSDVI